MIYAPRFPLMFKEKKMFENVNSVKELVSFHMKNLLLTNPYEKISDPNYGIGIRQLLFENMIQENLNLWQDKISRAINSHMPYVDLQQVNITPFFEENKVTIQIIYNLRDDTETQILEIDLNAGNSQQTGPVY